MSDQEEKPVVDPEEEEKDEEAEEDASEEEEEEKMDIHQAIAGVLKQALFVNGIARGLNEAAKSLDKGSGKIAFLANDCDEPNYKKLITALCREKNVPLVEVEKKQELGEWAGLCKWDPEGNARGGCNCSCVVVTKIDENWDAYRHLSNHLAEQKSAAA